MKKFKKIGVISSVILAVAVLTGCSAEAGSTESSLVDPWSITYLKVNDNSVICYSRYDNSATCDWSDVSIPNAVEVIELNDESPDSDYFRLSYLVDVNNETVPCITKNGNHPSCNFPSGAADSGYGESR
jgi:hypothetical protein